MKLAPTSPLATNGDTHAYTARKRSHPLSPSQRRGVHGHVLAADFYGCHVLAANFYGCRRLILLICLHEDLI